MKKIEIIKSSEEYTEIINTSKSKSKYFSVYYRKKIIIVIDMELLSLKKLAQQ
ncbi:MAG: hypothetical protein L6V91_00750 [Bacilli bacterium]|nr:MAG: hypothetical protein L6V91_00750 [Bacilli bacterium]